MTQPATARQFIGTAPMFFVRDVTKAADFYRDVLGFKYQEIWGHPPCFAMPHRDGFIFMLSQVDDPSRVLPNGADGKSWDAYVWVLDADALFEELKAKGAEIVHEPVDRPFYGNREFAIKDLDGYIIAFAHDIERRKKMK